MTPEKTTTSAAIVPEVEATPGRILPWVACVGGLIAMGLAGFASAELAYAAALGSAVALLNLGVIIKVVGVLLSGRGRRMLWGLLAVMKLALLGMLLFFLFERSYCSPVGFAIGYASLPLGVIVAQALGALEPARVN